MLQIITLEMADQGRPDFCVVFFMSLCTLVETNVNKVAVSNHAALKLHVQALTSFPRLIIIMSFISYQTEKVLLQRVIG